jgi:hypothetical protein
VVGGAAGDSRDPSSLIPSHSHPLRRVSKWWCIACYPSIHSNLCPNACRGVLGGLYVALTCA